VSQENVEIVLASFRAYIAGDLDRVLASWAPDIEVLPDAAVFPEAVPLRGREAFLQWLQEIATAWVREEVEICEAFAVSDGRVVLRQMWGGVGRTSGARMLSSVTGIWTVRSGLATRVEYHFDHAEALKAVGLEE
jgi:ketosteroid isomerase-like protein